MTNKVKIKITPLQEQQLKLFKAAERGMEDVIEREREWWSTYYELKDIDIDTFAKLLYSPDSYEVEPKYKEGDWVVGNCSNNLYALKNEIVADRTSEYKRFKVEHLSGGNFKQDSITTDNVRHATPEEIKAEKERQMWARIGRKVMEFKNGDVILKEDGIYTTVRNIDGAKHHYREGTRKGFFPVESFINYEEEMK